MAIEKMASLKVIGKLHEIEPIIKELILYENVSINAESDHYGNSYLIHEYEAEIEESSEYNIQDYFGIESECKDAILLVEDISKELGIKLNLEKDLIEKNDISYEQAIEMLNNYKSTNKKITDEIKNKKEDKEKLLYYKKVMDSIFDNSIELKKIADLNFFDYEIGILSNESRVKLKNNYESFIGIINRIGVVKPTAENLYLIIYLSQFKEQTTNFLKSLNWRRVNLPEKYTGTPAQISEQITEEIDVLSKEIKELSYLSETKNKNVNSSMNRIYNALKLEERTIEIAKEADFGDNIFLLNVWIRNSDINNFRESITKAYDKVKIIEAEKNGSSPPTVLKNNWFFRPFELIVKLYGLPSYRELDPTPFMALTYCLAFGIMFGDIGQGFIYFMAGYLLSKKMDLAGQLLMRLGATSMVFGLVYGSLFGLEKHQLPWLPSLFEGGPLSAENIPKILAVGIAYGIIALSGSFIYNIINSLKIGDKEEGLFGKNGVFGYLFFLSFIFTTLSLVGLVKIPLYVPLLLLVAFLAVIVLKEPLANALDKKELFPHGAGAYFTENIFESIETMLSTLSNTVSFVRVGAFALNHAGLFLAFMIISELVDNIVLKILILALGNILILVLEGLIVFIQGLRLQFYEMFNKYFVGEGIEFKSVKL
ncbi:MAG TPA: V-type ATPase 116kDa subunit family protein [Sedimentibacter sp.]|nr:V-type ATPase 116kDa subunit family protein [Sedimentibacter sp.]